MFGWCSVCMFLHGVCTRVLHCVWPATHPNRHLQTVRDKCFEKCIVKPSSSLGSSEQQCLARCCDRCAAGGLSGLPAWQLGCGCGAAGRAAPRSLLVSLSPVKVRGGDPDSHKGCAGHERPGVTADEATLVHCLLNGV